MTKKKAGIIGSTILFIILVLMFGPLDCFRHGYYCDEISYDILKQDLQEPVKLEDGDYEMQFSPSKKHLVGVEINLTNQSKKNKGKLVLTVLNDKGKIIDMVSVNLKKVQKHSWYKVKFNKELKKGQVYTLRFTAKNCKKIPYLQTIDKGYLGEETISGNVLLGYAYAQSTFTFQNKVLIILFLAAIWMFVYIKLSEQSILSRKGILMAVFIFCTALFSWNYMYNSMDTQNATFENFEDFSEKLVRGVITAEHQNIWFEDGSKYGLGFYNGALNEYTDDYWLQNYSRTVAAVVVDANKYSEQYAKAGNYIKFANGEIEKIVSTSEDENGRLLIYLDTDRILNPYKYGELSEAVYCDNNKKQIADLVKKELTSYQSQYGLQGKVFRHIARHLNYDEAILTLRLLCSIAMGMTGAAIIILLAFKYNKLFAGVFFTAFWLSPWIVNFANNLYWVEFTWFIPMAVGIFCSLKVNDKRCRYTSYILTFVSIMIKSLCGYEYISVIMMATIGFLLVDFAEAVFTKEKDRAMLAFRTIIVIGIMALLGFAAAICIHAQIRGAGNLLEGIKRIFKEDVLRRTSAKDLNEIASVYWPSLNASIWDTFRKYFHFSTQIITGIDGNLFPLLCIIPICIFGADIKRKKVDIEKASMYVISFLTSVSWFCLAKGHSFIHVNMNYVLWYFGFVQVCFYIIIEKIISVLRKK